MSNPVTDFTTDKGQKKSDFAAEDAQYRYGWSKCTPSFLQCCHKSGCMLFWICFLTLVQGIGINGFIGSSLPTMELRFGLSSTQSGVIAIIYDVTYMVACIPISYYGARAHKARFLGVGSLIMAMGSVLFFLPHFISGVYEYSDDSVSSTTCETGMNNTHGQPVCVTEERTLSLPGNTWIFVIAQILHGIGATPIYTLGVVYIDENVSRRFSSLFIGIFSIFVAAGPAVGFILNGIFLSIYGDVGRVDISRITLTEEDPRWYGAWWMGFVMSAILAILVAFPLLGYARQLPGTAYRLNKRQTECHLAGGEDKANDSEFGQKLKDLPRAICLLIMNFPYMFLILSSAADSFLLNGFVNFYPKFLGMQLNLSPSGSASFAGIGIFIGSLVGSLSGGGSITFFRMKCRPIIWLSTTMLMLSTFPLIGLMLNCEAPSYAGVQTGYSGLPFSGEVNLTSSCNSRCNCPDSTYQPMCSDSEVLYLSPCHAGCMDSTNNNTFSSCDCLAYPNITLVPSTSSQCQKPCSVIIYAILISTLFCIFTFWALVSNVQGTLRCVPHSQRALATGLGWVFGRLLGGIPGPIALGAVIDQGCLLWTKSCEGTSSCQIYDRAIVRRNFIILVICVRLFAVFLSLMAALTYKPPRAVLIKEEEVTKEEDNPTFTHL